MHERIDNESDFTGKEERKRRNVGIEKHAEKRINTGIEYALLGYLGYRFVFNNVVLGAHFVRRETAENLISSSRRNK